MVATRHYATAAQERAKRQAFAELLAAADAALDRMQRAEIIDICPEFVQLRGAAIHAREVTKK